MLTIPARMGDALGGLDVRTEVGGRQIEFTETVQRGGLRLRPHPVGPEHQGYIVLALEFPGDVEVHSHCGSTITIPKPVLRAVSSPTTSTAASTRPTSTPGSTAPWTT